MSGSSLKRHVSSCSIQLQSPIQREIKSNQTKEVKRKGSFISQVSVFPTRKDNDDNSNYSDSEIYSRQSHFGEKETFQTSPESLPTISISRNEERNESEQHILSEEDKSSKGLEIEDSNRDISSIKAAMLPKQYLSLPRHPLSRGQSLDKGTDSDFDAKSVSSVEEVRSMSEDFQKLLQKATKKISRLQIKCSNISDEQERLHTMNKELKEEVSTLQFELERNNEEREGLMLANEEFVEEVTELYQKQQKWEEEADCLQKEKEEIIQIMAGEKESMEEDFEQELDQIRNNTLILQEKIQEASVSKHDIMNRLSEEKKSNENELEELEDSLTEKHLALKAEVDNIESKVAATKESRKEIDDHLEYYSNELEKLDFKQEETQLEFRESEFNIKKINEKKINQLENRISKLIDENSRFGMDNDKKLKDINLFEKKEIELNDKISGIKLQNDNLVVRKKESLVKESKLEELFREQQGLKKSVHEEKMKVKEISDWRQHLIAKHEELLAENYRLLNKNGKLEQMLNSEATDIEDVLNVINNLQERKSSENDFEFNRYSKHY